MPLTIETATTESLAELDQVKAWLRIDHDADDVLLEMLINAAQRQIEARTGRALNAQQYKLTRPDFGRLPLLVLPRPPLVTVDSVKAYTAGVLTTLTVSTQYLVWPSGERGVGGIFLPDGVTWPSLDNRLDAVQVTYTAGYQTLDELPADLVAALWITLAAWYDTRRAGSLPEAAAELLAPWQVLDSRVAEVLR